MKADNSWIDVIMTQNKTDQFEHNIINKHPKNLNFEHDRHK